MTSTDGDVDNRVRAIAEVRPTSQSISHKLIAVYRRCLA